MNKKNGFTLIEVLIAMIVLAVGLLGLAGLQATSLRNNQSAYNRMKATQLAYDIADRMRANYAQAKNSEKKDNSYIVTKDQFPTSPVTECTSLPGCEPKIMAGNDLYEWQKALSDGLPDGTGEIKLDKGVLTITISWTENRDEDNDKEHAPDITTFLMSFQI